MPTLLHTLENFLIRWVKHQDFWNPLRSPTLNIFGLFSFFVTNIIFDYSDFLVTLIFWLFFLRFVREYFRLCILVQWQRLLSFNKKSSVLTTRVENGLSSCITETEVSCFATSWSGNGGQATEGCMTSRGSKFNFSDEIHNFELLFFKRSVKLSIISMLYFTFIVASTMYLVRSKFSCFQFFWTLVNLLSSRKNIVNASKYFGKGGKFFHRLSFCFLGKNKSETTQIGAG